MDSLEAENKRLRDLVSEKDAERDRLQARCENLAAEISDQKYYQKRIFDEGTADLRAVVAALKESAKVLVAANREHFDAARANYDECVGLRAVLNETQAELAALKELAVKAVYDEPEYPGDMPDDVWDIIHRGVYIEDRGRVAEVLRATVRLTKQGILDRLAAKDAK